MRTQYTLSRSAYAKRADAAARIPNFWPLVLEQAPIEIDQFISPPDSRIFSESLLRLDVTRPEIASGGSPRSLRMTFTFAPNDDFDDTELEKTFWWRRASDGWAGLVSEPVPIRWKKGKDLTEGLLGGAVALWKARQKTGDMTKTDLREYTALKKKVEHWNGSNTSFFTWFGWVSGRRWVSAEESAKEEREHEARREARKRGEDVEMPVTAYHADEDDANDDSAVEVHETGADLAICLAEDLWPNAIKLFNQAMEVDDVSEADFEEEEEEDFSDEDMEFGYDLPADIRALVTDRTRRPKDEAGGPSKKKKK